MATIEYKKLSTATEETILENNEEILALTTTGNRIKIKFTNLFNQIKDALTDFVTLTGIQTLQNKTLTNPRINSSVPIIASGYNINHIANLQTNVQDALNQLSLDIASLQDIVGESFVPNQLKSTSIEFSSLPNVIYTNSISLTPINAKSISVNIYVKTPGRLELTQDVVISIYYNPNTNELNAIDIKQDSKAAGGIIPDSSTGYMAIILYSPLN